METHVFVSVHHHCCFKWPSRGPLTKFISSNLHKMYAFFNISKLICLNNLKVEEITNKVICLPYNLVLLGFFLGLDKKSGISVVKKNMF